MTTDITPQFHLYVEQGVDFAQTFQWLAGGTFMAPIEDITPGYPTVMTVTGHGLNSLTAHPVEISGVEGVPDLNSRGTGIPLCSRIDADTFSVPLSSVGKLWEPGTGEITYQIPSDLTGFTGRCVIRKNWHSTTVIHEMTTENGGMTLTVDDAGIALYIPKAVTAAFSFKHAWYDVDLTASSGFESRVLKGPITLEREVSP